MTWPSGSLSWPSTMPPASESVSGPITRSPPRLSAFGQRGLDVRDLDVEGDMALVTLGPAGDAAADPDAV